MSARKSHKTSNNRTNRVGSARGGRPTRSEALRREIAAAGIDPDVVDPRRVLASIAIDQGAPPTARVAAAKALLASNATLTLPPAPPPPPDIEENEEMDALSRRALQILAQRGRPN